MELYKIVKFGHPVLRKSAEKVDEKQIHNPEFQKIIEKMFTTLEDAGGVGLAAPQINKSLQVFVVHIPEERDGEGFGPAVIINPVIENQSDETKEGWEGCLSLPKVRGLVPRPENITISFTDKSGKRKTLDLSGFEARVFQHEFDHLKGVLYVDRMDDIKTLISEEEYEKRKK